MSKRPLKDNLIFVAEAKEPYTPGLFYIIYQIEGKNLFGPVKWVSMQEICLRDAFYAVYNENRPEELGDWEIAISFNKIPNYRFQTTYSLFPCMGDIILSRNTILSAHQLDLKNIREAADDKGNPYYFYNFPLSDGV